ncbi:MAG TPA: oligosaccharide flippase family protein [Nocardioides sp.]|nr:oligosaccharide flippase family protein [Nocardioides sp.]
MKESGGRHRLDPTPGDRSAFVLIVSGTFGLQALIMVTGVITARLLGVEGRGQIALVFALGLAASQLTFGSSLPNAIAKQLAERGVAARDGLRRLARRAWWLLVPSLLAAGVMVFLQRTDAPDDVSGLAAAVFVMTLQTITFRILIGSLQGEAGHLGRMAVVAMIPQLLFTVALTAALVAGWDWGVAEVLISYFVASIIGLGVGFGALARPTHRTQDALDGAALRRMSLDAYVSSVRPVDSMGLDRILVGALLGTTQLGLYAAATAVSNLCRIVGNAVSVIVLPRVAMAHEDAAAQRRVVRRWVLLSATLILCVVACLELVVGPVIRIAFGSEFEAAIGPARWLILADGLLGLRTVLISVLQGYGRSAVASKVELAITPVMILGILVSSFYESLHGIGITMVAVGAISCIALGLAVVRGGAGSAPPPHRTRNLPGSGSFRVHKQAVRRSPDRDLPESSKAE